MVVINRHRPPLISQAAASHRKKQGMSAGGAAK